MILCAVAIWMEWVASHYQSVLHLGLAMATFTVGGLLAGFALAFFRLPITGRGYTFSAPLSVLFVFSISWHQPFAQVGVAVCAVLLLFAFVNSGYWRWQKAEVPGVRLLAQSLLLLAGLVAALYLSAHGSWDVDGEAKILSFVWYPLIGSLVAFFFGWALADPAPRDASEQLAD